MSSRAQSRPAAQREVETALRALEVQALDFAYRFVKDAAVRKAYIEKTQAFSSEVLTAYRAGSLTAKQAAEAANQMRNEVMEAARARSSDLGRAKAKALKAEGLDLADLAEKYSAKKYQRAFRDLSKSQQDEVFLEIASAAGRANPRVSAGAARLGAAGRGLWVLGIAIGAYNVGTAEHKGHALGREATSAAGGFADGAGAGALAGVWFGPVGVAAGVVVGGVLGSLLADQAYVELTGPRESAVRKFLPQFTGMFHVDEDGIARAMIVQLSINVDAVFDVFRELDRTYSSDVDDVALLYLEGIQSVGVGGGSVGHALKLHKELRAFLDDALESGFTSEREYRALRYLRSL